MSPRSSSHTRQVKYEEAFHHLMRQHQTISPILLKPPNSVNIFFDSLRQLRFNQRQRLLLLNLNPDSLQ